MQNFTYCNPTKLVFGRGVENEIGDHIQAMNPQPKSVLIVTGGSSAKRSGLLARVRTSLEAKGISVAEFSGVTPNPTYESVVACADVARASAADVIVAVGGGSVIDCAKATAVAVKYDGDVWDFFEGKAALTQALPIVCVLTIPAAGSEQSIRCVITRNEVKTGIGNGTIRPKIAFINPELFFTLPKNQIAAGVFDMMSHIMERYFTQTDAVDYTQAQAEAALRVIMENGLKVIENPQDYNAWSQVGLAGSFAHNGYFGMGHVEDWACHGIEHALSGWRPCITHGAGLAVVTPAWMQYVYPDNPRLFMRFARNVFGVQATEIEPAMQMMLAKLYGFIEKMGLPRTLSGLTTEEIPFDHLADLATRKTLGNFKRLQKVDVLAILKSVQ